MKKIIIIGCLGLLCGTLVQAQNKGKISVSAVPAPQPHYQQEYTLDAPVNAAAWNNQPSGMQVSFASGDKLYFRTEVPALEKTTDAWERTAWRGERVNAQVLVWSSDTVQQVRVKLNDLVNAQGDVIGKNNITVNMVRYVVSNFPYGAKDVTCDVSPYKDSVYLMPDRFESFDRFEVPGKTVRPVWVSINIPDSAKQGVYTGTIEVQSEKTKSVLQVKLKVQNQVLPKPKDWAHRLDLWQNPIVVARYNDVKPWSEEHKTLLAKHLKLYADAGGKYITTYAVHSPWADNSYMIEDAMIDWVKQKNGSWKFDYNIFDTYVELAMKAGVDKAITIYTPLPWGNRFRYLDEASGNYITEVWNPDTQEYKKFWHVFLDDLKAHLKQK
ncbi:MAG TPA: glycoside hydrolase domain-containing protein, partial [Niastella sp.]|nr:glycoside hydrolase domain-containing protein [Niastella sp.]